VIAVSLGKIGVNLNQQILAMNRAVASGQDIPSIDEAKEVVNKVYVSVRQQYPTIWEIFTSTYLNKKLINFYFFLFLKIN
jgi:hypothetical protein